MSSKSVSPFKHRVNIHEHTLCSSHANAQPVHIEPYSGDQHDVSKESLSTAPVHSHAGNIMRRQTRPTLIEQSECSVACHTTLSGSSYI